MFKSETYRDRAAQYKHRGEQASAPDEKRRFQDLERSFGTLADNEEWLSENYAATVYTPEQDRTASALAAQEEHILRCLGAAVIMQWTTLPTKLQRELFDTAGAVGDVLSTPELRGQIARFLHKHKHGDAAI